MTRSYLCAPVLGLFASALFAATTGSLHAQLLSADKPVSPTGYSSSLSEDSSTSASLAPRQDLFQQGLVTTGSAPVASAAGVAPAATPSYSAGPSRQPFHSLALAFVVGIQGIGVEAATPLATRINLRGGAQLLGVSTDFTSDGLQGNGQLSLENVYASVDFYPFRRSSFHLSPGITIHNDTHVTANLLAPGGSSFTLGDQDYTSDPTNPIRGVARFTLGNSVAPRFTLGWGNMIPRNGSHFSFPFEVGFQVISSPTVQLYLTGNGCDADGCGDINSNGGAQNIQDEINLLENDLHPLRIYPLLTTGISYRFGRSYDRVR